MKIPTGGIVRDAERPDEVRFLNRRLKSGCNKAKKVLFTRVFTAPFYKERFFMKTKFFTTQRIVTLAMFAAIGFGLSWLDFSIFPAVPFLELDFSNIATLLGGYILGPISALIIEGVKQLLHFVINSSTGGVGEIANFLMTSAFVLVPSVLYKFKKGKRYVVLGMGIGTVLQILVALLCNRFITYPIYAVIFQEFLQSLFPMLTGGVTAANLFGATWGFLIAFNGIKAVSVSILTFLLYKRLSLAMKWMFGERKTLAKKVRGVYNNSMENTSVTNGAEETVALAEKLAQTFTGGEVVLLSGDLGAGKTVFAKGVAKALGVRSDVKSPTFTLCCEYDGDKLRLIHIDAYRLKNGEEAEACGLNEKFGDKSAVCLIEWPSQIESVLPDNVLRVNIERLGDNERKITINADK